MCVIKATMTTFCILFFWVLLFKIRNGSQEICIFCRKKSRAKNVLNRQTENFLWFIRNAARIKNPFCIIHSSFQFPLLILVKSFTHFFRIIFWLDSHMPNIWREKYQFQSYSCHMYLLWCQKKPTQTEILNSDPLFKNSLSEFFTISFPLNCTFPFIFTEIN